MKKKIKLMIITPYFYPKIGGLENYAYNISKGLMKSYNYEIIVITSNHEKSKEYKEENLDGMKVYRLPRQFKVSNTPISFKWKNQIKEIIEKEKPNIINAHTPVPFISDVACRIAHKKGIPFLLTYHTGSMKKENAFIKNLIINFYESRYLKRTINYSTIIISTSNWVKESFINKYKDSRIITPAVNIRESLNQINNLELLFVGSLNKTEDYKGLKYLFEAIKNVKKTIPKIKLTVVGEGDNRKFYENQVKELDLSLNVQFKGALFKEDLFNEYKKTSIFVHPSYFDNFPIVLLEAMSYKKPLIGSRVGAIPDIIEDGVNGLLIAPKDPQALANAITKILENPKLAKKMGEKGYKKVKENFTWDISTKKMNKLVLEVLN